METCIIETGSGRFKIEKAALCNDKNTKLHINEFIVCRCLSARENLGAEIYIELGPGG